MPDAPYPWSQPIPASGSGGLFGGLMGGGGGAVPGLLSGGGNLDGLMEQLIRRQLEAANRPNWGAMARGFAQAAMPSRLPIPFGAALGMAAGAMSEGGEGADLKMMQALKLASDIKNAQQLAKLRSMTPGQMSDFLKEIEKWRQGGQSGPPPTPGGDTGTSIRPLSSTAPFRITGTEETTGDLSGSSGEPPTGEAAGGDSDLTAGGGTPPAPRPQAAVRAPVVPAAYSPGSAGKERFLSLASQFESNNRNVPNYRYDAGHTAGGYFQITDPTWRDFAPPEIQAQFPRAMDAPFEVQKAVAHNIPPQRWTDNNPKLAAALPAAGLPPPRMPAESWLNQPPTNSGFRDPSFAPGNQAALERFRGSVLGTLAGGDPLVNPDQSPTGAVRGGPPPDEVIPSGPRPSIPGLLRTQYTGQVNPDQSPSIQMGGQPMPAPIAPTGRPPMAPPSMVPNIPQPDTAATEALLARLAAARALSEAQGLGDIWKPFQDMILNSPRYQREKIQIEKGAAIPYQYLEPQYNVPLQTQLETAKQTAIQLGKYLGPEYDATIQKMLKDIDERAKSEQRSVKLRIGNQEYDVTAAERAAWARGEGIPSLGIPPDPSKAPPGTAPPPGVAPPPGGTRVYTPEEQKETEARGAGLAKREQEYRDAADLSRETKSTLTAVAADLNNVVKGPWAGAAQTFASYARLIDPSFNQQVSSYEGAQSAVNALVRKAVRESDPNPTFLQTKMAIESMPSPLQSEGGSQKIAGRMLGFANHNIARAAAMEQWLDKNGSMKGFDADWRQNVSPFAFAYLQMDTADQQYVAQYLGQTKQGERERQRLAAQVAYIKKNGLEQ